MNQWVIGFAVAVFAIGMAVVTDLARKPIVDCTPVKADMAPFTVRSRFPQPLAPIERKPEAEPS